MKKIVIGIDARTIAQPNQITGVGVTVELLVDYLDRQGVGCVLLYDQPPQKNYKHHRNVVLMPSPRPLWEQLKLGPALRRLGIRLYHETWNYGLPWHLPQTVKTITTIHDLILLDEPAASSELKERLFTAYRRWAVKRAISQSTCLIAVSEGTANEISRQFPDAIAKTTVIYNGIRPTFFNPPNTQPGETLKRYGIGRPYLLYFGGFHPRKNVKFLTQAFLAAKLNGHRLVLAGALTPDFQAFLATLPADQKSQVVTPGYVDSTDQAALYRHATLFVSSSLSEGFGYPLAEAMAAQTLAAVSDLPVFREVGGSTVSYFNPTRRSELTALIKRMVQLSPAERRVVLTAQSRQATKFNAEAMGKQTLKLYNRLINEG